LREPTHAAASSEAAGGCDPTPPRLLGGAGLERPRVLTSNQLTGQTGAEKIVSMGGALLAITTSQRDGILWIRCSGELDLSSCGALRDAIGAAVEGELGNLVIDLRGLSFVDSSGLRCILEGQQIAEAGGGSLGVVVAEDSPALRLFRLTGTNAVLDVAVYDSTHDAAAGAAAADGSG
jgi:anti-sigma B factor antagonist